MERRPRLLYKIGKIIFIYFFNKYNMSTSTIITVIGLSVIFFYAIIKILNFYGFDSSVYGTYLFFYATIVLTTLILPNSAPEI